MTKFRTLAAVGLVVGLVVFASTTLAIGTAVGLGTANSYVVLAGSTVTNTGPSVLNGDLGLSPGSAVTGFPPGTVNGSQHVADAAALQAKNDLTTAYNVAAGQPVDVSVSADLGGSTLVPGVYNSATGLSLTGTVTLNAGGDPNAVWVFQAGSTLITASNSTVSFTNGAQPCNVFWQVGSSATLGTNTTFAGTILALTSVTLQTGATIDGRVLARNGAVTLDDNVITPSVCAAPPPSPSPSAAPSSSPSGAPSSGPSSPPSAAPSAAPVPTPSGGAGGITRGPVGSRFPSPPSTDSLPGGAGRDTPATMVNILLAVGGGLIFAGLVLRRPARRS